MKYLREGITVCLNVTLVIWNYPKSRLAAKCMRGTVPCIVKNLSLYILHCTKKSHRLFREAQCQCKLSAKDGPANLKSRIVNELQIYSLTIQT